MRRFNEALIADPRAAGRDGACRNHPPTRASPTRSVIGREAEARHWPEIAVRRVTPGYFAALHVPLVEGRLIGDGDTATAPAVLLVNEAAAERFFPHQNPIGQQVGFWGTARRVIGVVGNERFHGVAEAAPPAVYAPLDQTPSITGSEVLLVRAAVDPGALATAIRGRIAGLIRAAILGSRNCGRSRGIARLAAFRDAAADALCGSSIGLASIGIHGV